MRIELVQDVALVGVEVEGEDVVIGVYGGIDNTCASVRFTFADALVRAENVARLRRWEQVGTTLSMLVHDGTVELFSERSRFARALESA